MTTTKSPLTRGPECGGVETAPRSSLGRGLSDHVGHAPSGQWCSAASGVRWRGPQRPPACRPGSARDRGGLWGGASVTKPLVKFFFCIRTNFPRREQFAAKSQICFNLKNTINSSVVHTVGVEYFDRGFSGHRGSLWLWGSSPMQIVSRQWLDSSRGGEQFFLRGAKC